MVKYKSVDYETINQALDLKRALERSFQSKIFILKRDFIKSTYYIESVDDLKEIENVELQSFEAGFYFGQEFTKLN